jgi:mannosyltransferase
LRTDWAAVGAITVLAAAVRLLGLDAKGFWEDEAVSIYLVHMDLGGMLSTIPDTERTPPLYYLLAWGWTRLFGYGEVGIRSLSVLIGTATVPVAFLAARELISRRAGIVVAALVAVNPLLVWYSQEGRAYALLVLTSALALFFFARALRDPRPRWLALWALCSILAIVAHYFAAFLFIGEAAWLLASMKRRRPALIAAGVPAAAGLALIPLAIAQGGSRENDWISDISIVQRVVEIPGFFMVGFEVPYPVVMGVAVAAGALTAWGLLLLLRRGDPSERRGSLVAGSVGAAGLIIPLALVVVGLDFFIYKNVLATLLPFAVVVGAGLGGVAAGRLGIGLAASMVALSLAVVVATASQPKYQRETWREGAEALGAPEGERAIVATPGDPALEPLGVYLPEARPLENGTALVAEIDVLALPRRDLGAIENPELPSLDQPPRPPADGFELVSSRRTEDFLLLRYRAPAPVSLSRDLLASSAADQGVEALVLLEPPRQ